ncbi:MAG: energy transducer TonB [Acidobacteriaceae bacterium]
MKHKIALLTSNSWLCVLVLGPAILISQYAPAQNSERKIKQRFSPEYPTLAKQFNAAGTVKLQIEITPDGEVKSVKPLGGHPLLIPAAESAVHKWKYEPAKESTTTVIEFRFMPNE